MLPQTAVLIGAGLATCGWLYTARRARTLSRKQHTVNVMMQAVNNKDFREALQLISNAKNLGECPDLSKPENSNLKEALKLVTNQIEFVAAGLRNGDFDERMVYDSWRGRSGMVTAQMLSIAEQSFAPDFGEPRGHARVLELG